METNLIGEMDMLREMGVRPSFPEMARRYGMDRHAVAKYWKEGAGMEDGRSARRSGSGRYRDETEGSEPDDVDLAERRDGNPMLEAAIRPAGPGERVRLIVHSGCGCHCRWPGWISICEEAGIIRSMSRKGGSREPASPQRRGAARLERPWCGRRQPSRLTPRDESVAGRLHPGAPLTEARNRPRPRKTSLP